MNIWINEKEDQNIVSFLYTREYIYIALDL